MFRFFWILLFTLVHHSCMVNSWMKNSVSVKNELAERFTIQPIPSNAEYGTNYTSSINKTISRIYVYSNSQNDQWKPSRVTFESFDANESYPILVVVQQRKDVLSWKVPLTMESKGINYLYQRTSRTLCADISCFNSSDSGDEMAITIETSSPNNVSFSLNVTKLQDFNIKLGQEYETVVTPSEPTFYFYSFGENVSSVLLEITSTDDYCMTLSIQNISCPVFDLERTVQYRGSWETISSKGGILITRREFPEGVYIIFVVHSDDSDCLLTSIDNSFIDSVSKGRMKTVQFKLNKNLSYEDYLFASLSVIFLFSMVYIIAGLLVFCNTSKKSDLLIIDERETFVEESTASGSNIVTVSKEIETIDENEIEEKKTTSSAKLHQNRGLKPKDTVSVDSSLDETDLDLLLNVRSYWKDIIRTRTILYVSDLARKNPKILKIKSRLYFWNLLTVAVFYSLPVVQLVFTYQKVLNMSGNQDMCYYNFLCSHRLWQISDFNHVFTNIGYILLGLLFILLTYKRDVTSNLYSTKGIPHHYGLYYAMGTALMMEGVLSACYHICPNHSNIQFDTSFMYIISMLCMLKIYQTRHPDINASAYTTFLVLAVVIFIGMCGVLDGSIYFYILFTVLHISTCIFLSFQIYYVGRWNFGINAFKQRATEFTRGLCFGARPLYPSRMVLLILGNICNWGISGFIWMSNKGNFATYLLIIFMANLLLYLTFYISMKIISGEKILFQPALYIILSIITWAASAYFFLAKATTWQLTPAQSRTYNMPCVLMKFYDNHDIWHLISAGSIFFSFLTLLTLDDDLKDKDRTEIKVF